MVRETTPLGQRRSEELCDPLTGGWVECNMNSEDKYASAADDGILQVRQNNCSVIKFANHGALDSGNVTGSVWRYHNICGCSWGSRLWPCITEVLYDPDATA
jgi:hypothetical protein